MTTRPERRGESGTTVLEVSITSAILLVVLAAFLGILQSLTRTERRVQALVANEQNVRFVMSEIARDLRSANPMLPLTSVDLYRDKVELALGPSAGTPTYVRWSYDSGSQTLTRSTLSAPGGSVLSTRSRLTKVRNSDSGTPLFGYFGQSATDLLAAGNAADVANCALRVRVTVLSDSEPGPLPFREERDVEIRNRLPGGVGCG